MRCTMNRIPNDRWLRHSLLALSLAGATAWSAAAAADVVGQAKAVQATVLGASASISDTGTLAGPDDAREASQLSSNVLSAISAEVPHATTIASRTPAGSAVASEASLAGLVIALP